nr:ribonuclease H-like domain-containing protein [Tanacetum cinerariifolium]
MTVADGGPTLTAAGPQLTTTRPPVNGAASRRHVAASYWTAASDVAPTSAPPATGQRRSTPPTTGQRRRITVVIGGQRWWSTTVAGGEPPLTAAGPPLTTTGQRCVSNLVDSINNLDADKPLHVQNSNTSNSALIPFKLLVPKIIKFGSYATSDVLSAQWDRCNAMVLTWIMNIASQDVYMGLIYTENAATIWKELNEIYDKVDGVKPEEELEAELEFILTLELALKQTFNANSDVKMNSNSASSSSSGFTPEQMQKLLNMINDKPSGSIHANMAGKASFFNGNFWFNINFSKYLYANSSLSVTTITMGWIIDSGANQHLTVSTVRMFNIVDISELKITVGHPNGTHATTIHVGNLKLSNNVILYDVWVVLGYCDLKREKILGTGSESGSLYLFDMNKSNCIGQSNMVMSFHVSKLLWHNRLGHPADQVLSVLKKDLNISDNTFVPMCKACQSAKQTREPFPLSDHKSKTLGELVHLDLAVWVYLVKTKDEVFDVFISYLKLIHYYFNVKVKAVSPNNEERDSSVEEGSLPHFNGTQGFLPAVYFLKVPIMKREIHQLRKVVCHTSMVLKSKFDYSLYTKHNGDKFIAFLVSLDDIVITGNDDVGLLAARLVDISVPKNSILSFKETANDKYLSNFTTYQKLVGLLAARLVDISVPKNSILSFKETANDKYLSNFTTYQKLVEFMIISGADNRPPMLEKSLYDSWKSRMELDIENWENGRMILNSLQNGSLVWPTIEENGTTMTKKYEEVSVAEKLQADCDLKAANIVLQGLPPDVTLQPFKKEESGPDHHPHTSLV